MYCINILKSSEVVECHCERRHRRQELEEVLVVCPFWSQLCSMTLASDVKLPQAQTLPCAGSSSNECREDFTCYEILFKVVECNL